MKQQQACGKSDDGFTLIEMLVVLGLVAIVSGFTWASFRKPSPAADVRRTGDAVAIYFDRVRAKALSDWRPYSVSFNLHKRTISSDAVEDQLRWPEGITMVADTSERERLGNTFRIKFNPDGSASGGTVQFKRDLARYTVRVNWLTGQVVRRHER